MTMTAWLVSLNYVLAWLSTSIYPVEHHSSYSSDINVLQLLKQSHHNVNNAFKSFAFVIIESVAQRLVFQG